MEDYEKRATEAEAVIEKLVQRLNSLESNKNNGNTASTSSYASEWQGVDKRQPKWHLPKGGVDKGLRLANSFTKDVKTPFIPENGNLIKWYICGPTVYDSAHLGHARNYLSFDVIRRILEDYFHYDVFAVMNITDVDDKIILKARRQFLFERYEKQHPYFTEEVKKDVILAWTDEIASLQKKLSAVEADKNKLDAEKQSETKLLREKLEAAQKTQSSIAEIKTGAAESAAEVLRKSMDPLSVLLDSKHGSTVTDQAIYRPLAAKFELEFLEDLRVLGVKLPDVMTRVTEYINEVIETVKTIIKNGFAYESNGSVYFDTEKFKASGHSYGKLAPWNIGNASLFEEGEGALSKTASSEKRNGADFALWKKSKPGEPIWNSPWGNGRPGWHIECSAMAGDILGMKLDIHAGGEDLRFPHHDNELAQAEAYFGNHQWVNYFLHAGHLHINGLKMSKSLKNFITIRDALKKNTPRQLRLMFILKAWEATLNYTDAAVEEAKTKEKTINEFFLLVQNVQRSQMASIHQIVQRWEQAEKDLYKYFLETVQKVDEALKDSFNTPLSMQLILDLISRTNGYINQTTQRRVLLVKKISDWIAHILTIFGLYGGSEEGSASSKEETLTPVLNALSTFRTQIRESAKQKKPTSDFLALCDVLRDDLLPPLGVRLEDSVEFPWKLVNPQELMAEIASKKKSLAEKALTTLQSQIRAVEDEIRRLEEGKISAKDTFAADKQYSKFDEKGIPTHDAKGEELTKTAKKSVLKTWELQDKKNEKYVKSIQENPKTIEEKTAKLNGLKDELKKLQPQSNNNNNA